MAEDLVLESCDLDCASNNRDHHTADVGCTQLIVRRGQPFNVTLHFSPRGYEEGVDQLALNIQTGPCPAEESGTRAHIKLSDSLQEGAWNASISSNEGDKLILSIISPPDARIGLYNISLEASTGYQGTSFHLGTFTLLFNPWCPEDTVYLEREDQRTEYIMTQYGMIFQGTKTSITSVPWNFGQFEDGILEACLQILDTSPKFVKDSNRDCSRRNDPVYISRVVSAMVNCNDEDRGVLYGRWDNLYDDGISPMFWIGSVDILRRWRKFGCQPVKYGQCWVFAAVACSVLRCLGIPARVITNYHSAHDTNSNLLIEQYLDQEGNKQKKQKDMIWNFHCWVESWMARPDLEGGYDGWQVVDPTPQEKSDGVYCCGPAPVIAIKEGDLNVKYDVRFIFAEVNADVIYFVEQKDGSVKQTRYTDTVGQSISTKAVGRDNREDITHNYKYPEGSEDERRVFEKANKLHGSQREDAVPNNFDVTIKIKVSEGMDKGKDFDVRALINNHTDVDKDCRLTFCARVASYTGKIGPECGMKDLMNLKLEAQSEKEVPLQVLYEKYGPVLTDDNLIKLVALLYDSSSTDILLAMRDIHIKNPDIKVRVLGEPMQKRKLVADITLKNPLSEPLNDCCFTVEGAGLTEGLIEKKLDYTVEPGQEAKVRVDLYPQQSGLRKLVVDFESDHLKAVKGHRNVIIAPQPK
ncbi:-glutamine gamma-glutamyltransferase 2 [Pelobates cultripes]|uniref:Protein-glutamine gamma-glutamyltransferase 2 n=1 Tax=Pelobates cultripes TaxID=61616 RepID=A0AAD1S4N3_PELCU|nr:-glutamine gamma-glutamyltransferase 2 [Pelobates cultripes]